MSKTDNALYILLEQVKEGKYRVENGKLFNAQNKELGRIKENGYKTYYVRQGDFRIHVYAHRFMFLYYYGHLDPKLTINHIDGNKLNNHKENLEQISRSDNTKHSFETGLQTGIGSENNFSKLTEDKVREIKKLLNKGLKQKEIAEIFGVTPTNIHWIKKGVSWGHVS